MTISRLIGPDYTVNPRRYLHPDPETDPGGNVDDPLNEEDPTEDTDPPKDKWPEDWRNQMVGALPEDASDEDKEAHEKALKQAARFQNPADLWKSYREAQNKLATTRIDDLPENPTDEQVKAFRESKGIPEAPEGYYDNMGDLVVGEEDKQYVDKFLKEVAHPNNWTPEQVQQAYQFHQANKEAQIAEFDKNNDEAQAATHEALSDDLGKEYKAGIARVNNLIAMADKEVQERLHQLATPNGVSMFNDPATVKFFLTLANEIDPLPAHISGSGANVDTIENELADIDKMMRTNRTAYNEDKKTQDRYLELCDAYKKLTGKTWTGTQPS